MKIGTREIGIDMLPYLIAEIGVNHDGDLARAKDLIWKAARCGAAAAKFQAYKADTLAHRDSPTYFQQVGGAAKTQHEFFRRSDGFGPSEYQQLAVTCRDAGIDFLCTPFDLQAVEFLRPLVAAWKIASGDITNLPFVNQVTATAISSRKPVLLSTGAATLREIENALDYTVKEEAAVLHCVLAYPTSPEDANLLMIPDLARRFPEAAIVGYSDHTLATPDMEVCTLAYVMGARIIEKHFTDDKLRPGNDHYHSADPMDFLTLTQNIKRVHRYFGSPHKGPIPAEDVARRMARRGLYVARAVRAGQELDPLDVIALRPSAAIGPEDWERVIGKRTTVALDPGMPLTWGVLSGT